MNIRLESAASMSTSPQSLAADGIERDSCLREKENICIMNEY
jgi:hypothetical protein